MQVDTQPHAEANYEYTKDISKNNLHRFKNWKRKIVAIVYTRPGFENYQVQLFRTI